MRGNGTAIIAATKSAAMQRTAAPGLSKKPLYAKRDAMKGGKPFIFHRIHRLCRWGGAIFRSAAQKNHFHSLAMQDESFHPAWSVSKNVVFLTRQARPCNARAC